MWRVKPLDAILASAHRQSLHRSRGPVQLIMLGIGGIIGSGIFVLTAEAAQKAGPGMIFAFVIAGAVCAVAALCYAEMAAMIPASGSAYTYSYAVMVINRSSEERRCPTGSTYRSQCQGVGRAEEARSLCR